MKYSAFMLALMVAVLSLHGETADQIAISLRQKALTNSGAVEIVRDLTTEVGPRLAGSEAEKRAATWAVERFKKLGFDKVWIETFPIEQGWERGVEKAEVVSASPQNLVITALGGSVATPPGGLEAPIVLFKTYDAFLAAPAEAITNKIVVVTQPMARFRDGSGYGVVNKIRNKGPAQAALRGAVAYLSRSLATDTHRIPHTGQTGFPTNAPRIPAAALSVPDAEQLERLVATGEPVRIKLWLTPRDLGPVTSQNVIAEIKGREHPDEIVLLGAHLDSWDLGTGALDDGAGVGITMAAAKLIGDLPQRPKRTIRVVLYGSEEFGLFGGRAYATLHKAELDHYVVVAEPDEGQGPVYAFQTGVANPDEPSLKQIRTALAPLGISPGDNTSKGNSDVEPLASLSVPAVTLQLDSTDYFDFHHTPDDTFDKIAPERINQTTAAYVVFTYLAAELDGDYRVKISPDKNEK
jgi:carboxypeptidase Q